GVDEFYAQPKTLVIWMDHRPVEMEDDGLPLYPRGIVAETLKADLLIALEKPIEINLPAREFLAQIMILAEVFPGLASDGSNGKDKLLPSCKKKILVLAEVEFLFVAVDQPVGNQPFQ